MKSGIKACASCAEIPSPSSKSSISTAAPNSPNTPASVHIKRSNEEPFVEGGPTKIGRYFDIVENRDPRIRLANIKKEVSAVPTGQKDIARERTHDFTEPNRFENFLLDKSRSDDNSQAENSQPNDNRLEDGQVENVYLKDDCRAKDARIECARFERQPKYPPGRPSERTLERQFERQPERPSERQTERQPERRSECPPERQSGRHPEHQSVKKFSKPSMSLDQEFTRLKYDVLSSLVSAIQTSAESSASSKSLDSHYQDCLCLSAQVDLLFSLRDTFNIEGTSSIKLSGIYRIILMRLKAVASITNITNSTVKMQNKTIEGLCKLLTRLQ